MGPQINHHQELLATWRALGGTEANSGWQVIPISPDGPCRFLAGRHFPGNEESLLVGFTTMRVLPAINLPQGRGFHVGKVSLSGREADRTWVALSREDSGSLELFTMMATDVITTIQRYPKVNEERIFDLFLSRIRAWQNFMRENRDHMLSPEAEVGLYGELYFLQSLIMAGLPANTAVEGWEGPLDGIQDFSFGTGAIEVKSTVAMGTFPAKIGSLEQLDDSLIRPIFLAGIRLELSAYGETLPERAASVHNCLRGDSAAQSMLEDKLLRAGLLPGAEDRYTRKFNHLDTRLLLITEGFPRLTRGNIANEIRRAHYEIDLDLISSQNIDMSSVMTELGMI
ncbi:PD-(D/E)XK motif protein [Pusillimonas sp. MFBS29]|uniref:PD-(D/E)XK motif protein n=1 Tax=Pusillimonas sp. MFBS29 TaxID=2886690 RepID=UPI001D130229|nr:PD-(D/E)XK motif protein [Pusillimonas sp. MFBS29]MCC2596086.1 PD-(D/E)XK motif protein [Pusillimonas sp. MFBS29]